MARMSCSLFVTLLVVVATAHAADDLKEAETQIRGAWKKHRSLTAKMSVRTALATGKASTSQGDGTFELMKKEGKTLVRMEMANKMIHGPEGREITSKTIAIIDGKHVYVLVDMLGQRTARKANVEPEMTGDPGLILESLHKRHDLKLLADEKVGDRQAFVIEATPKPPRPDAEPPPLKTVFYFCQEDGVILRMVEHNLQAQVATTTTFSDLQFDADIDPQRFVFKVPEGVQLTDLTGGKP